MLIGEIGIRGYKSFGNNEQVLKLNMDKGELLLLVGNNGNGKCVEKSTLIDLEINDLDINSKLIYFLESTEQGNRIFQNIEKNNKSLYEKIQKFRC
jgi:ABC-type dipeptide/oligopeptide/nickel transport system ATPase component